MPTEEIFTTPDSRRAEGTIRSTPSAGALGRRHRGPRAHRSRTAGSSMSTPSSGAEIVRGQLDERRARRAASARSRWSTARRASARPGITFFDTLYDENATCHIAYGFGDPRGVRRRARRRHERLDRAHRLHGRRPGARGRRPHADGEAVPIIRDDDWQLPSDRTAASSATPSSPCGVGANVQPGPACRRLAPASSTRRRAGGHACRVPRRRGYVDVLYTDQHIRRALIEYAPTRCSRGRRRGCSSARKQHRRRTRGGRRAHRRRRTRPARRPPRRARRQGAHARDRRGEQPPDQRAAEQLDRRRRPERSAGPSRCSASRISTGSGRLVEFTVRLDEDDPVAAWREHVRAHRRARATPGRAAGSTPSASRAPAPT